VLSSHILWHTSLQPAARPIDGVTQEEGQHRRSYPHLPSAVHA
ncbi:unnamed protein product, partial [Pylaiella littoralis]